MSNRQKSIPCIFESNLFFLASLNQHLPAKCHASPPACRLLPGIHLYARIIIKAITFCSRQAAGTERPSKSAHYWSFRHSPSTVCPKYYGQLSIIPVRLLNKSCFNKFLGCSTQRMSIATDPLCSFFLWGGIILYFQQWKYHMLLYHRITK